MDNEKTNKKTDDGVVNVTKGFFKKLYKSVTNFEQYPELASQGTWSAIKYLITLMLFFTIIMVVGLIFQFREGFNSFLYKFDQAVPELTYSNGILDVKSEEPIVIDDGIEGKFIIDTKTEDVQKIEEYKKVDSSSPNKLVALKDKVIIVSSENRYMTFTYQEITDKLSNSGLDSFDKAELLNYIDKEAKYTVYGAFALIMFIGLFIVYSISVLLDVVSVAVLGYMTSIFAGLKIRFAAIFNMAVYALTLSVILNVIYLVVKIYTNFEIKYFDVAYIAVAYIYMAAAIFLLKANFIKKQAELIKIVEEQDKVKIEIEERERQKEEKDKEKEDEKKEDKDSSKKKKKEDTNLKDSPEGSKA